MVGRIELLNLVSLDAKLWNFMNTCIRVWKNLGVLGYNIKSMYEFEKEWICSCLI